MAGRRLVMLGIVGALAVLIGGCGEDAPPRADRVGPVQRPGVQADGSVRLPNQWSLTPAGVQIPLGSFPVNLALDPRGRYAAVLHCGYGAPEIVMVDLAAGTVRSRLAVGEAFWGLAFAPDGRHLFCSGSSDEGVRVFACVDGVLSADGLIPLRHDPGRGIPCGLAVSVDGRRLYAAELWGQTVTAVDVDARAAVFDVALGPMAGTATGPAPGDPGADKRDAAAAQPPMDDAPFPYACALDEAHGRLYVSSWAQAAVLAVDLATRAVVARIAVGAHPNDMVLSPDAASLYVAAANGDCVSVIDTGSGRVRETLAIALHPGMPAGATPDGLALSRDGGLLFVAAATLNAVAVFDVAHRGHSRALGFIPAGWYPTAVRIAPDGRTLVITNGKGGSSHANPHGPQPGELLPDRSQYIAALITGSLSLVHLPEPGDLEAAMRAWTAQVEHDSPLRADRRPTLAPAPGNPVPAAPGGASPIRYCIYVIKENRTYDQVFGDMPAGDGDAKLCLFPEAVTPNLHRLARDYVLFDNFYANAEVSAGGHEWSMAAMASDFVEKNWPIVYGRHGGGKIPYPSEGHFALATPAGGYLWDAAAAAGITYRSYGEFIENGRTPDDPGRTRQAALQGHFDPRFRSFDLDYPDAKRVDEYLRELQHFVAAGDMPRLQIVRLPSDHTHGVSPGKPTPTAYVAENDAAVGRLVAALSRTPFWPRTAVFIVEDDAQNGPDHVDCHRTEALVISPFTRRHAVDQTPYSTCSMLRTIELILGLGPLSTYDAAAAPMYNAFTADADTSPYDAVPATADLTPKNPANPLAEASTRGLDFSVEDAVDDAVLNHMVWGSVRGAEPMPAPVVASFVRAVAKRDDDDE